MNEMLQVKFVELDKIIPYVNNPKAHPDDQIKKIASSIKEFGFKVPIIVDKDFVIIAGHGRYYAAKLLGLDKVPVIIAEDLTPAQVKAFRIADNKVAESEWDYESLLAELEQLKDLDYDIKLTGFDEEEIERLIKSVGVEEVKLDDVADDTEIEMQQHEPYSIYYDIWVLGEHKLMCGDSTKHDDVLRLMDGDHRHMKPVSLFEQFIMHFSDDKDLVVDLFAGSGTALIASERLGRVNYSMELNPEFVDLIVKRYIDNFGDDEVYLVRDGKKIEFDEIRDEFLKCLIGEWR